MAPYPGSSLGAQTTVLVAPGGGHFTRVVLSNWEYSWWLNGLAAPGGFFSVNSVTLRVDQATGQCPIAQSHWKNQPDTWPLKALIIGSNYYDQSELLGLLKGGTKGDASLVLAREFICASLNIAHGAYAPPEVTDAMSKAELRFYWVSDKLPYDVKRASEGGQTMLDLADVLKAFNSGSLTTDCVR